MAGNIVPDIGLMTSICLLVGLFRLPSSLASDFG